MLDARRMRVLREVAARGSFSAAAEALSFTQSAVSQHVAALEREAGTQLVERRRSGVRLTEAGRVLVGHADAILALLEAEPDEAGERLRAGDMDLALVYDHESTPGLLAPGLELCHLLDDRYDAILPADHELAGRARLSLADLAGEQWVASTSLCGCRQITETMCREAGFEPRVAFEADDTMAAQALVAAGASDAMLHTLEDVAEEFREARLELAAS